MTAAAALVAPPTGHELRITNLTGKVLAFRIESLEVPNPIRPISGTVRPGNVPFQIGNLPAGRYRASFTLEGKRAERTFRLDRTTRLTVRLVNSSLTVTSD